VGTGTFTIPLMKRIGYKPHFAGAVEAAASTGGQLMPPVMGAAAFIMAEVIGVQYLEIAKAALIPALLYTLAVFIMIDIEAQKTGLKGLPKSELPDAKKIFKDGYHLLIPPIALVLALAVLLYSPMRSALIGIVAVVVVSQYKKHTRIDFKKLLEALKSGAMGALEVAMACGTAGIVVGIFTLTGLGMKLSTLLIDVSGGNLFILLILTMITSLFLGMGMPTTAAYIVLAMTVAPALVRMGVHPIAAHLFVFYFGIISAITPPVALAAYAGAAIAGTSPMKTGAAATKIGLAAFIIPYMFVYGAPLLMMGSATSQVILAIITACIGIFALSTGVHGYFMGRLNILEKVLFIISALLLLKPGGVTDILGIGLFAVLVAKQFVSRKMSKGNDQQTVTTEA
jgi:TRAP transporter 4TM/12TM fusion protein